MSKTNALGEMIYNTLKISSFSGGLTFYSSTLYYTWTDEDFDPICNIMDGIGAGTTAGLCALIWPISIPMLGIYGWKCYRRD